MAYLQPNQLTTSTQYDYIVSLFLNSLKSTNTQRSYKRSIDNFFKFIYGDNTLTLKDMIIDSAVAQEYVNFYTEKLNNREIKISTYNSAIKGIKKFYDWLIIKTTSNTKGIKLLKINPFKGVSTLDEKDRQGSDYLTPEEIELMLNNPIGRNNHIQTRNALMFELALITALRCDAICRLTEENIQKKGDDICIIALDKGRKLFTKPINSIYDRLIKWYEFDKKIRIEDKGTIFNIQKEYANQIIIAWSKKLNINKKITFHSLRITTAINIYHDTKDKYRVQKFLGHKLVNTTDVYLDKENAIMKDGEKILTDIKEKVDTKKELENLSKEELIALLLSTDTEIKQKILTNL